MTPDPTTLSGVPKLKSPDTDLVPPDTASGLHFCFDAPNRKSVAAFHAAAVGAGGKDNGEPGLRADYGPNYYAAFVVDPDGKLAALINADKQLGKDINIQHTPTLYVVSNKRNGKPFVEVVDRSQLYALIDTMLKE